MRTFVKYQCESPLPAGHIGGVSLDSHTLPHTLNWQGTGLGWSTKPSCTTLAVSLIHYLPIIWTSLLNSCSLGLSELFIISMLSAWADQFLLLGTFFWRREEISTNSQALLNWSPWEIFLRDSEEWYLELQICIGSVFPRNLILLWIINLTFPSTCLHLFSSSSWRLTLK